MLLCALRNKSPGCKLADPACELDLVSGQRALVLDSVFFVLEFLISISIQEHKDKEGSNFIAKGPPHNKLNNLVICSILLL
jgi:hypothetical protein